MIKINIRFKWGIQNKLHTVSQRRGNLACGLAYIGGIEVRLKRDRLEIYTVILALHEIVQVVLEVLFLGSLLPS